MNEIENEYNQEQEDAVIHRKCQGNKLVPGESLGQTPQKGRTE